MTSTRVARQPAPTDAPAPTTAERPRRSGRSGQDAPAPARSTADPPVPVAVPRTAFVVLVLFLVTGGVLGILVLNTKINENAFVLDELREQERQLDQRQQQLEEEIARASSTAQLRAAARELGLVDRRHAKEYLDLSGARSELPVRSPAAPTGPTGTGADGGGDVPAQ